MIDVDSLSSTYKTHATADDIIIEPYLPNAMVKIESIKGLLVNDPMVSDYLLNKKATLALFYAKQRPYFETAPNEEKIILETKEILKKYKHRYPHLDFFIAGGVAVGDAYREVAMHDFQVLLPVMFLLIATLLFFFFRTVVGVFIPFAVTALCALGAMALAGFFNFSFNNILGLVPQTLMGIAMADTIHLLVSYYQARDEGYTKQESLKSCLGKNFTPTLLTTLSTALGFISFVSASMKPIVHFGIICAIGTFLAWLICFGTSPLIAILDTSKGSSLKRKKKPLLFISLLGFIKRRNLPIIGCGFVLGILSLSIGLMNEVNTNPVNYFDQSVPVRKSHDRLISDLGGLPGPEIVIDSGEVNGLYSPTFLKNVESFITELLLDKEILKTNSILPIIKKVNQALYENKESAYQIPANRKAVAESLLVYQMSLGNGKSLKERMSLDNRYMRVSILWSLQETKESRLKLQAIENLAKKHKIDIKITGKAPLFISLNKQVTDSMVSSLSIALFLVSLFLCFTFKSWRLAFISLVPNVLPLAMGAMVMTLFSIPLSIGSALVFSVCLGIVVDDTIHFLLHFQKLIHHSPNRSTLEVLEEIFKTTGSSILTTTLVLALAFGLFVLANFQLNVHFGLIAATILLSALAADLVLLPALLYRYRKQITNQA